MRKVDKTWWNVYCGSGDGVVEKHSSDSLVGRGLGSTRWSWEMNCVLQNPFYFMGVVRQIKAQLMSGG